MLYGRINQITINTKYGRAKCWLLFCVRWKWNETKWNKNTSSIRFYAMHQWKSTICFANNEIFLTHTLPLYANTFCLLRIRICEFIIITFTNRKKNMNAEAEIEKNENKNKNKNMSMHVNKISIICCWFFGKHGVRTLGLSVFILIKLQFYSQKTTRTVQRNIVDVLQDFRSMHRLFN